MRTTSASRAGAGWSTPSLDFDLWWYWFEHLDPTDERRQPAAPLPAGRTATTGCCPCRLRSRPPRAPAPARATRRAGPACSPATTPTASSTTTWSTTSRELSRSRRRLLPGRLAMRARRARQARRGRPRAPGRSGTALYDFGSWSLLARDWSAGTSSTTTTRSCSPTTAAYLLRPLDDVFAGWTHGAATGGACRPTKRRTSRARRTSEHRCRSPTRSGGDGHAATTWIRCRPPAPELVLPVPSAGRSSPTRASDDRLEHRHAGSATKRESSSSTSSGSAAT